MQVARRDRLYRDHSRLNRPGIIVSPGEEFGAETELNTGDWLRSLEDRWEFAKSRGPNPTVCIGVDGARPGDMLAVRILDIQVDELGYTGFDGRIHELPRLIYPRQWEVNTKTVRIRDGWVEWSDRIRIPVRPMIGTLGTAPEFETLRNTKAGNYGGNMDVNEVTAGSTVYLPVFVDGALLHVGDVHAVQGDGEINVGGGIECRATVRLVADILPRPASMKWVRIEDDRYIMAVACGRSVEECFYSAAREILEWMVESYGFTVEEAYLLMGQVMEARCTQFVNPTRTYICKVPKAFLLPQDFR